MVMVAEGIEDALIAALAQPDLCTITAVSVANMAKIRLPAAIGTVLVIADNAAAALIRRRPAGT